jgi:hypothetical protein
VESISGTIRLEGADNAKKPSEERCFYGMLMVSIVFMKDFETGETNTYYCGIESEGRGR